MCLAASLIGESQVMAEATGAGEVMTEPDTKDKVAAAFDHYWQYAKLWRTWVVGIAVAALYILTNKNVGGAIEGRVDDDQDCC